MIPVVNAIEIKEIKDILEGQPLAIIFDGTTRICEAFATLCRFLDEGSFSPNLPSVSAICREYGGMADPNAQPTPEFIRLHDHGFNCVQPGFNYFMNKFFGQDGNTPQLKR